jgi:hypothetical protein
LGKEYHRRYALIRLNISAEGFSEERFVKDILCPHLIQFDIIVDVRKLLTNKKMKKRGGIVSFAKFKNDVNQWIREQPQAYHSTFIDLYGLKNDFPNFKTSKGLEPYSRIKTIEAGISEEIGHPKFIPFVQLHEFESLLFADPEQTEEWLSLYNNFEKGSLRKISDNNGGNPELINEGIETAPSKRILSLCQNYNKVDDGILLLKEIGLVKLRSSCAHFNTWITCLEQLNRPSLKVSNSN